MNEKTFSRIIAVLLFLAVIGGTWDAWWHGAMGRDTLFEPPHLLLYFSVLSAISFASYAWYVSRHRLWKRLAFVLLLIPVSAPFDELWHRIFGVEDLSSPLIVWSPPHLAIVLALAASIILLFPLLRKDSKDMQILFGSLSFAALLSILLFLVSPLQPEGSWHLLGFFGSGFIAFILVSIFLLSQRWIPHKAGAIFCSAFFLSLSSIGFNEKIAEGVIVNPHAHSPTFLIVFSILAVALIISLLSRNTLLSGALAGLSWSLLIYGLSWIFFEPAFVYSFTEGLIAVFSATFGGLLAGLLALFYLRATRDKKKGGKK